MLNQQMQPTINDLKLMAGYPPPPDQRVTHENQLLGPYNRWSFQNELKLNRTADVWRGNEPVFQLEYTGFDINQATYRNRAGTQFTFNDMVEVSYTDGIVVLHKGRIVYEKYLNGMQPHTLHAWASCSKSMTGTLAAVLAHEGVFHPDTFVSEHLPELKDSGFGDATIRQIMDMTSAMGVSPDDLSYTIALGWKERPTGYSGPESAYEVLPTMKKAGDHGSRFDYFTANTTCSHGSSSVY